METTWNNKKIHSVTDVLLEACSTHQTQTDQIQQIISDLTELFQDPPPPPPSDTI